MSTASPPAADGDPTRVPRARRFPPALTRRLPTPQRRASVFFTKKGLAKAMLETR